jgi:sugar phosphate isomerase/epimerase
VRISASSVIWRGLSLEIAAQQARLASYSAFEPLLWPEEVQGGFHGDIRELPSAEADAIFTGTGLDVAAIHLAGIFTEPEELRRELIEYAKRAIVFSAEIGCPTIVEGGPLRTPDQFRPYVEALQELVPVLEGTGVRLALENHHGFLVECAEDYERIFEAIDHPLVGITLDSGHFVASRVDPVAFVDRFGAKVLHVHAKDQIGEQCVRLGEGDARLPELVAALSAHGYSGFLTVELELPPEADRTAYQDAAVAGLAYLNALIE